MPDRTTPTNETSALASPWLTVLLGVTATVLAVLVALQVHDVGEPTRSRAATGSALTDAGARDRLLDVAATAGTRVLTYHHDTFDADVSATRRSLTPDFADEYAAAMEQVRADTVRDQIDQETTPVSSAVVSATDSRAEVLVFANQQTTAGASGARRVRRTRLVVRLVRDEGRWTVAGVTALG